MRRWRWWPASEKEPSLRQRQARGRPEAHADGASRARLPLRGPRRAAVAARAASTGAAAASSTGSTSRRVSTAGPTPGAPAVHPSPTAFPPSASCTPATSPSRWHRPHRRRTYAAMPSAWAGPTCPGTRSAPSASRLTRGRRVVRLNVFLRDGDDVYRTYFLQHGEAVQGIGSVWSLMSLTPYGGQSDDEDSAPRAGRRRRRLRSGTAATTSSTIRRHRPAAAEEAKSATTRAKVRA